MRRTLLPLAVALTLVTALPAGAAKDGVRRAQQPYMHSALGTPEVFGWCYTVDRPNEPTENHGCVRFQTGARESMVDFRVVDDSGLPVPAAASQDADRDGVYETSFRFCGESEPHDFADGEIVVWLNPVTWSDVPCPGAATKGVVHATFQVVR